MSREEINEMPAGRQMDVLLAEQVMGWRRFPSRHNREQTILARSQQEADSVRLGFDINHLAPAYSTDITAAWQMVEEAKQPSLYPFFLTQDRYGGAYSNGLWLASFGVRYRAYEEGPLGDDTDAMDYWNLRFGEWKEDPTLPFGGYCPSSTGPAKGNIAAANTPPLAIGKARLLAHFHAAPTP